MTTYRSEDDEEEKDQVLPLNMINNAIKVKKEDIKDEDKELFSRISLREK